MDSGLQKDSILRFGPFELDLRLLELRRTGLPIKLPPQALKVLVALASRPAELVTREEIQEQVWGGDTFVDFEQGLAHCIYQIRQALRDDSQAPRYIETLPRRGYRFLPPRQDLGRIESLAILPLANLSGGTEQEYFADGMTEALITELGKIGALRIISRQSIMQFKHTNKPIPEIARKLRVDALVEGAVVRDGDRVRITVRLIAAEPERHLWTECYERSLDDLLELYREVVRAIAQQINLVLTAGEDVRLAHATRVNSEAHEAYLRGRYFWNRRTGEGFWRAIDCFKLAIDKDEGYALAHAGLADSYTLLGVYEGPPGDFFPKAQIAAQKALELDSELAESHASLAMIEGIYFWSWESGIQGFKRAIELNPGCATARHWYAAFLAMMERNQEALDEIKFAHQLDPLSPQINTRMGEHFYYLHQFERAIEQLRRTLEIFPDYAPAHYSLGQTYLQKEMSVEALGEMKVAVELSGGALLHGLGRAYALSGNREAALSVINSLRARTAQGYVPASTIACVAMALGDGETALDLMERALEDHDGWLFALAKEGAFDALGNAARFHAVLDRMNLPRRHFRPHALAPPRQE